MATKYEELGEAHKVALVRSAEYERNSQQFVLRLIQELYSLLECPEGRILVCPASAELKEDTRYTIPGTMEPNEDGYWHIGVILTIATKISPTLRTRFYLMFKGQDGVFVVRVTPEGKDLRVRTTEAADFRAVAEQMFLLVKEYLDSGLDRFLAQGASTRTIGFNNLPT